jgi:hypothetical protein
MSNAAGLLKREDDVVGAAIEKKMILMRRID